MQTDNTADRVIGMKRLFAIFTAVLFFALAGCSPGREASSASSGNSPEVTPTPQSEVQTSAEFDLHEYYQLPESVEIRDNVADRTELPGNKQAMDNLKELFDRAMGGRWGEAEALVSSASNIFNEFSGVKISDFAIRSVEINDDDNETLVRFDLTVTESDSELFEVGTTPWQAKLVISESNWAEYILPESRVVSTCNFSEMQPVEMFCYRLAANLPELTGTDFRACFDFSDDSALNRTVDAACIALSYANLPEVEYTPESKSPEVFYADMEKVFGADLRDVDVTRYSWYQDSQMIIPIPKGSRWVYAVITESTHDAAQDVYTVTMDLYSDTVCWVVGRTVRYTVSVNEDGSFRLREVQEIYSSGYAIETGTL